MSTLQVTVINARPPTSGKTELYAELHLNGVTHTTKTIYKFPPTPWWSYVCETFTFHAGSFNPDTDALRVDVYDRLTCDGLLTRNLLPISKYAAAGTVDHCIELRGLQGDREGGSLRIQVIYGDGEPQVANPQQQQL